MGYKRAGFEVVGNCEIDPRINRVYKHNLHPRLNFVMDARDFAKKCHARDVPEELFYLDILDGSPPCSVFSTAGEREAGWGKEKRFAEGQKLQTLDDLFFVYLDIAKTLQPKICIAENVTGLIKGNAKGYVNEIIKGFKEAGYSVQLFKLNAAFMDVPQKRERVFFIANRMGYPALKLNFHHSPLYFRDVRGAEPGAQPSPETAWLLKNVIPSDRCIADINERLLNKHSNFTSPVYQDHCVALTLSASGSSYRACDGTRVTEKDMKAISSWPEDYDFLDGCYKDVKFICGMSVPPNMMANIASEVWRQWLGRKET